MRPVDWRKVALKALAPAGLGLGYMLWRHGGTLPASTRYWGLLALVVGPMIGAAVAGELLSQTGRAGVGKLVGFAGLIWVFGGSALLAAKTDAVTLTDAERAAFVSVREGDELRLRHPTLDFSILHPGPGFTAELSQAFKRDAQIHSFVDPVAAVRLTIGLFKGQGESNAALRELLEGMGRQADVVSGGAKVPARVVELKTSAGDPPRGDLHIVLGDGRHYRTTAYGWRAPDGTSFAILIAITSRTADAGTDVLASFRP